MNQYNIAYGAVTATYVLVSGIHVMDGIFTSRLDDKDVIEAKSGAIEAREEIPN